MEATADVRSRPMDEEVLVATLVGLTTELERHWAAALAQGSFAEVDRYVAAVHALHRALLALADRPTWSSTP